MNSKLNNNNNEFQFKNHVKYFKSVITYILHGILCNPI